MMDTYTLFPGNRHNLALIITLQLLMLLMLLIMLLISMYIHVIKQN